MPQPLVFFGVTADRDTGLSAGDERTTSQVPAEARTRRSLLVGAATVSTGLALVGTGHPEAGQFILLGGWLLLGFAIHRFGRGSGADARGPDETPPRDV